MGASTGKPRPIVVSGGGLAGNLAAISLANSLGQGFEIIQIMEPGAPPEDLVYGHAADPEIYNFLRRAGLGEPALILATGTSFSYGTEYRHWPGSGGWMQCHHAPFPTIAGIPLRHHITRAGLALEPFLISAQAARAGRFAHPPSDPDNDLSGAEYGYQFDPAEWTAQLDQLVAGSRVRRITSPIVEVAIEDGLVSAIQLENGQTVTADLFIDANGPSRRIIEAAGGRFRTERTIRAGLSVRETQQPGPPCLTIEADAAGWTSKAHLQTAERMIRVGADDAGAEAPSAVSIALGELSEAWVGNCVAIGHAASVIEPLTPAPMIMLRRDIERLLELVPASAGMTVERREFNRRFLEDVEHIRIFHDALFLSVSAPEEPYWQAAAASTENAKLQRKISQFGNRGILTSYDLEPFNEEDWTIAHMGLGRRPEHYDRQIDGLAAAESDQALARMKQSIRQLVSKMPPHNVYLNRFKQYLRRQNHA
ncbi:tryptophan 7-halogenase [Hyphobacterium sp. HN65]|uniref:Tryptophan 7-halogenase n=1 Tax=Hyphobacterium lacteum TaxID=3116575 RepID=A0ABU7LSE1_9PROT|nr:tryptophan 7-halogenase [Hyphobacterium sp. HN65]MEE2526835.1 tryptophan 7-halogenase [Hyphobacterium sp. HN65]